MYITSLYNLLTLTVRWWDGEWYHRFIIFAVFAVSLKDSHCMSPFTSV